MAKGLLDSGEKKAIGLDDLSDGFSAVELNQNQDPEQETQPEPKEEERVESKAQEETASPTTETQAEPEPITKTEESTSKQFDFSSLNKELGKKYESLDQVKADLNRPTMESEYTEAKRQLDEWQAKYNDLNETHELLIEQTDPSTYFSSNDAMKLEAFKKANPDKDASIAQRLFSTQDLSSIDDIDMVKMGWKFNTPNLKGTDRDLETSIAEELNQDPDTPVSEWPVSAQNRLARMAADYTNQFKNIKSSITLPEKLNIEELKTQRKQASEQRLTAVTDGWTQIAKDSLKDAKSIKVPIGDKQEGQEQQFFEWVLDAPPEKEVSDLRAEFIRMNLDPAVEKARFNEALNVMLFQKNSPKIMAKYGEHLLANSEEKHLEETHNPNPLKDSERTDLSGTDKERAEQTRFATQDVIPRFKNSPLFMKK